MTHRYTVKGMSCSGCAAHVRKAIESVPGVTKAEVQQQPGQAVVTMEKHVDTALLQQAIGQYGNYEINEIQ